MYPTEAFRKKGDVSAEFIRRTPGRKFPTPSGKETAGKQIPVSNSIGTVDRLWRYPVKSMRGEELETAFVGFGGVYGDRLLAFRNSASPKIFPYLTARQLQTMLLYCPRFRDGEAMVDVQTPDGEMLSIDDPALIRKLGDGLTDAPTLTLLRSDRAMTDCRPISLFSLQTVRQIGDEIGVALTQCASGRTFIWTLPIRRALAKMNLWGTACVWGQVQLSPFWSVTSAAR